MPFSAKRLITLFLILLISFQTLAAVDSDGDGFSDDQELALGTDPDDSLSHPASSSTPPEFYVDTDGDEIEDYLDFDDDNDGLFDFLERDTIGTDHRLIDTDGDSLGDAVEWLSGLDPLVNMVY